jgi:hypothetical protein
MSRSARLPFKRDLNFACITFLAPWKALPCLDSHIDQMGASSDSGNTLDESLLLKDFLTSVHSSRRSPSALRNGILRPSAFPFDSGTRVSQVEYRLTYVCSIKRR